MELTSIIVKTHQMCLLVQIQKVILLDYREFYEKFEEHKELSQYVWEAMHTSFPIGSTSAIVSQLPKEQVEKFLSQVS